MKRRALQVGAVVLGVVVVLVVLWRLETGAPREPLASETADASLDDPAGLDALVQRARAGLLAEPPAAGSLDGVPGRLVFVCAYGVPVPTCARGQAATLSASVDAAAAALRAQRADWVGRADRLRVKLDVVTWEESAWWPDDELHRAAGVDGFSVEGGGFVVPSEVLERGLTPQEDSRRIDTEALIALLAQRGPTPARSGFAFQRLRTTAWVEGAPGAAAVPAYRTHLRDAPNGADPEVVLARAVAAADHLAASVQADGRIRYLYDPVKAEEPGGYNRLRHAGTTYAMIQAWDRARVPGWRFAAEAAIRWLLTQTGRDERHGPYGGGEVAYVKEGSHLKLGGAGLALVMLATWEASTGEATYRDDAEAFARFLVSQQQSSGEFVYFPSRKPGGPPRDDTSAYYPGEAILGLVLQHRLDAEPLWLETAVRGADWLIDVRDAGKGPQELANDHWLLIALSHLHAATGDPRYLDHSLAIVDAVAYQAERTAASVPRYPDYRGGFYDPPRSTPASTRAEGLVAVLDTCAAAGRDCAPVRDQLTLTLSHILTAQYVPASSWWIREPRIVLGGVAGGITDTAIRNDYVQHALSAMLGTERHLRSDRRLPGGPTWEAADSEVFPGVPAPVLRSLRRPGRAVRGDTRWDRRSPPPPDRGPDVVVEP